MKQTFLLLMLLLTLSAKSQITFHYGTSIYQTCDYYSYGKKDTCFVLIHGGGWLTGDKTDWKSYPYYLLDNGYDVMTLNYSYAFGNINFDSIQRDVKMCLDSAQAILGIEHFVLLGASAGATIAVRYALTGLDSRVFYTIGISGVYDMNGLNVDPSIIPMVNEYTDGDVFNASCINFPTGLTGKTLLIHGKIDQTVYSYHSVQMQKALETACKESNLIVIPGMNHVSHDILTYLIFEVSIFYVRRL